jgi:two-component system sensor histidine kinase QseC
MYSLRHRLALALAAGFAVVSVGVGLLTTRVLEARVTDEFDAGVLARARTLAALTEQESGHVELDYTPALMPEFEREDDPEVFEFWKDDGAPLLRSKRLSGDLPRLPTLASATRVEAGTLPDGRPARIALLAFLPRAPEVAGGDAPVAEAPGASTGERRGLYLSVGRGRGRLDALVARIAWGVLGAAALATLLAALWAWRALARGLAPVDELAARVGGLDAERLEARVALPRTPREVAPVVAQVNALLERIAASRARERRFAGNVAHELRTPIAELRSLADVGARWPDDPEAVARYFEDVAAIARRMRAVVDDLLLLSRCHAGVEGVARADTPLVPRVEAAWAAHAEEAARRGLSARIEGPRDLVLDTDPGKLEMVVRNLVANAVAYARDGTEVALVAAADGPRWRLEVENAAEPLPPEGLSRLGEPFWRGDAARSSPDHAGLGLALVAALSELLAVEVRFEQDAGGRFRARLEGGGARRAPPPAPETRGAPAAGALRSP